LIQMTHSAALVARMVEMNLKLPAFTETTGESSETLRAVASGAIEAPQSVLAAFNLTKQGDSFQWIG